MKLFLAVIVASLVFLVEVPVSANGSAALGGPAFGPFELSIFD
jgi:hypothetical protein